MSLRLTCMVIVALSAACGVDLAVPPEARVLCSVDGDCPDAMVCNLGSRECVTREALDRSPPRLVSAAAASPIAIVLTFDERVSNVTAEQVSSYRTEPALAFTSAVLGSEGQSVLLGVERQDAIDYTVIVAEVIDASGNLIQTPNDRAIFRGVPTQPDTQAPELLVPNAGERFVGRDAVDLRWTQRDGAASYTVDVAYDDAMLEPIPGSPFQVAPLRPGGAPEPSLRVPLPGAVTFYWSVRADVTVGPAARSFFELIGDAIHVYCPQQQACLDDGAAGNVTHPFRTIGRAIAVAAADGLSRVLVADRGAGTAYIELVTLSAGVSLYGGYSPDFTARGFTTRLRNEGSVTIYGEDIDVPTVVDGFTIEGGTSSVVHTVELLRGHNVTLSNDVITGGTTILESIAVNLTDSGTRSGPQPVIDACAITASEAGQTSVGVAGVDSNVVVRDSSVTSGSAIAPFTSDSIALRLRGGAVLTGNVIHSGQAGRFSSGVRLAINELGVASRIAGNTVTTSSCDQAAGIVVGSQLDAPAAQLISPVIVNNVVDITTGTSPFGPAATGIGAHRGAVVNNTLRIRPCPLGSCIRYGVFTNVQDGELVLANNFVVMGSNSETVGACLGMDTSPSQGSRPPARIENNLLVECAASTFVRLVDIFGPASAIDTIGGVNTPSLYTALVPNAPVSATGNFVENAAAYFVNAASGNYRLGSSTSAAVRGGGLDASGPLYGLVTTDFDGASRTCGGAGVCYSVGAYELD